MRKLIVIFVALLLIVTSCMPAGSEGLIQETSGGIVKGVYEGSAVNIPPGGLYEDTTIIITQNSSVSRKSDSYEIPGRIYQVEGPKDEVFKKPVEISIPYDPSSLPSNRSEDDIFPVMMIEGVWYRAEGYVDKDKNIVHAITLHNGDWSWAYDKVGEWAGEVVSFFRKETEIPENLPDAYALLEQRENEFQRIWVEAEVRVDSTLSMDDLFDYYEDEIKGAFATTALALSASTGLMVDLGGKAGILYVSGVPSGVVVTGSAAVGLITLEYIGFAGGVVFAIKLARDNVVVWNEIYKLELAYQQLEEARAIVWALEHPGAFTVSPEHEKTLNDYYAALQISQTVSKPLELDLAVSAYEDPIGAIVQPEELQTTTRLFMPRETITLPGGFVAPGDYDQDGNLDLVTGCTGNDPFAHIIKNDPEGVLVEVQTLPCGNNIHGGSQPWVDYDKDGDLDLALPGRNASYMYENDGGIFVLDQRVSFPVQFSGGAWFKWGDIDGVNGPDLVLVGTNYSGLYINDGTGRLVMAQKFPTRDNHSGDLGDYDQDGDLDLVVIGARPGGGTDTSRFHFEVYRNDGGALNLYVDLESRGGDVRWVDYDKDGLLDIFIAGSVSSTINHVELWRQGPVGMFTLDTAQQALDAFAALGPPARNEGVSAWGDFDNDGDLDLFLSSPISEGCLTMTYRNNPTGTLVADSGTRLHNVPLCYWYPAWGDFDNDGDLDLVVFEDGNGTKIFENMEK